jgi:sigma-B regulation protein RsbU (phosphoserine phosphatase)
VVIETASAPARLLVVDDNEDNRYTLLQRLKRHGYTNVAVAVDGREALGMLRESAFDLVLLDVMMPELNGYEVLEQLKADERLRHIPVIMISAMDQLESVVRCIELGAEDYLAKPFNPTLLRARVGASLEKKRLRDETAAHLARIEAELESAREIQLDLVPHDFPEATAAVPVEIFAALHPARQVGGDLYDFFYVDPQTLCLVIADVSDKGAPAALFMAHANSVIRIIAGLLRTPDGGRPSPADIMAKANEELCRGNRAGMFVTVVFAMLALPNGVLSFCNAGHNVPYVTDTAGTVVPLDGARSKPLGIRPTYTYATAQRTLAPGDCLFLFTDGITEAMDGLGEFFDDERLQQGLRAMVGGRSVDIVDGVVRSVHLFAGATPQSDDMAAMAVRFLPKGRDEAAALAPWRAGTRMVIMNRLAELPIVTRRLDEIAAAHSLSDDVLADMQVAADEVLANIIEHAYSDDDLHEINIECRISDNLIELQFEDGGQPFDPLSIRSANRSAPLQEREPGGVGIHFVRSLMSEVSYARVDDRNRLLLRKHITTGEKSIGSA